MVKDNKWKSDDKLTTGIRVMIAVLSVLMLVLVSVFAVSLSTFISISSNAACPEIFSLEDLYLLKLAPVILIIFSFLPGILIILNFKTYWWKLSAVIYFLVLILLYGIWYILVKINCG